MTAARWIWRGQRNNDQKPKRKRSSAERLGARRREQLIIRRCCFMSRLSATIVFASPGPRSLAMVVSRWARSISRSFMAEQGRETTHRRQACPSCRFQVKITISPYSRYAFLNRRCDVCLMTEATPAARASINVHVLVQNPCVSAEFLPIIEG